MAVCVDRVERFVRKVTTESQKGKENVAFADPFNGENDVMSDQNREGGESHWCKRALSRWW